MRGTKFRYTGRTEREILTENLNALRQQHLLNNTSPSKRKANSVPATPSSPQGDLAEIREFVRLLVSSIVHESFSNSSAGYSSLPRSTMSEPMGCSDRFCQENVIPCLETVCEEARTKSRDGNDLSDYYFRDSSSESGYTHFDGRTILNRLHNNVGDGILINRHPHTSSNSSAVMKQQNALNNARITKKFSIVRAFIPSFLLVLLVLTVSMIFVLESESDAFVTFKNIPEMMNLNYQYYQPFKDFLLRRLGLKN